jgi:hypothetical protein
VADRSTDPFALNRHRFVDHDLRRLSKPVVGSRLVVSRISGASINVPETSRTTTVPVSSKWSDWMTSAGRGLPKSPDIATVTRSPRFMHPSRR